MTDPNYVHYVMIIDRSGSMSLIREDMQGGLRSFTEKQLQGVNGNKRTVSFYQFDTQHERLWDFGLLRNVRNYELVPRGGTALLDACGQAITEVGRKLADLPEEKRPGYVMVIIVTDGQENSSKRYTRQEVRAMIEHQRDVYGWRFTYLGANQDAFAEGTSLGISTPSIMSWAGTSRSMNATYDVLAAAVSAGTTTTTSGIYYSTAQREYVSGTGSPSR